MRGILALVLTFLVASSFSGVPAFTRMSSDAIDQNTLGVEKKVVVGSSSGTSADQAPILVVEPRAGLAAFWNYKGGVLVSIIVRAFLLRNIGSEGDVEMTIYPLVDLERYQFRAPPGELSTSVHIKKDECIDISYTLWRGGGDNYFTLYWSMQCNSVNGTHSIHLDFIGGFLWKYNGLRWDLKGSFNVELGTSCQLARLATAFSSQEIFDSESEGYRVQVDTSGLPSVESVCFSYSFSNDSTDWSSWESALGSSGSTYWYDIPRDVWIVHVNEEVMCKGRISAGGETIYTSTALGKISDDDTGPLLSNLQAMGKIDYSYLGSYRIQIDATDPEGIGTVWFCYNFAWWGWENVDAWLNESLAAQYSGHLGSTYWYDIPRQVWHRLDIIGQTIYFIAYVEDSDNDRVNDRKSTFSDLYPGWGEESGINEPSPSAGEDTIAKLVNMNNTDDYLELKANGVFYLRENGIEVSGTWNVWSPNKIQLVGFDHVIIGYGTIDGDTLIDPDGNVWREMDSRIDTTPPIAEAIPDQTVKEDTLTRFYGSNCYDKSGITRYEWTFFDGTLKTLTGKVVEYTFSTPGIYIVTLNVSDAFGNWNTDTFTITVRDATPPTIESFIRIPSDADPGQKVTISVKVTDMGSGVKNVYLFYTVNNGSSWEAHRTMDYNAATGCYETTIPGQTVGTWVKYRITAYDNAGNSRAEDNSGQYYSYNVVPEFPSFPILPLFIITTLLAITVYRRKRSIGLQSTEETAIHTVRIRNRCSRRKLTQENRNNTSAAERNWHKDRRSMQAQMDRVKRESHDYNCKLSRKEHQPKNMRSLTQTGEHAQRFAPKKRENLPQDKRANRATLPLKSKKEGSFKTAESTHKPDNPSHPKALVRNNALPSNTRHISCTTVPRTQENRQHNVLRKPGSGTLSNRKRQLPRKNCKNRGRDHSTVGSRL